MKRLRHTFQSPSLRGSGRFGRRGGDPPAEMQLFQSPSLRGSGRFRSRAEQLRKDLTVSIPFIAGQWSLHQVGGSLGREPFVSIPFIAGQWSLLPGAAVPLVCLNTFQSPSLRGSGRFRRVARPGWRAVQVSIPFIAGQWSLHYGPAGRLRKQPLPVSIPFIAGQWSLHMIAVITPVADAMFQSPSLRGSGRFSRLSLAWKVRVSPCFNPLHCGAVVASTGEDGPRLHVREVSIPFIAGQWSLPRGGGGLSLRPPVSIPFIAGQWSLQQEEK